MNFQLRCEGKPRRIETNLHMASQMEGMVDTEVVDMVEVMVEEGEVMEVGGEVVAVDGRSFSCCRHYDRRHPALNSGYVLKISYGQLSASHSSFRQC